MKNIIYILKFILLTMFIHANANANANLNNWDDVDQEDIQIKKPIYTISRYDKHAVLSKNLKIKLRDFGNILLSTKSNNNDQKKYGVQIINNNKIFNVFQSNVALDSTVKLNVIHYSGNVVAFIVKEQYISRYMGKSTEISRANLYLYNLNTNEFSRLKVFNSNGFIGDSGLKFLLGDQIIENKTKNNYIYNAKVLSEKTKEIKNLRVVFDEDLNCISPDKICVSEYFGKFKADFIDENKK